MPAAGQLVVLGSSTTALAVARQAWRRGLPVVIADTVAGIAFRTRRARSVLLPGGDDASLQRLAGLARDGATMLVATSDDWVRFLCRHRGALAGGYTHILHPRDEVLDLCLNKLRFARWCAQQGIPSPAACSGDDPGGLARLRLPVLIRPAETVHSAPAHVPKALQAASAAELGEGLERFRARGVEAVVSESLLDRPLTQFSIPFVHRAGRTQAYVARKVRPRPESCKVGTWVELYPAPEVEALARRVVAALDAEGIGEVEILRCEQTGESHVIEVNARPWSQFPMAAAAGYDFLAVALDRESAAPEAARRPVRWIDFTSDLYVVFGQGDGLRARGQIGWGEYLASLASVNSFAKLDLLDPWPFLFDLGQFVGDRLSASDRPSP